MLSPTLLQNCHLFSGSTNKFLYHRGLCSCSKSLFIYMAWINGTGVVPVHKFWIHFQRAEVFPPETTTTTNGETTDTGAIRCGGWCCTIPSRRLPPTKGDCLSSPSSLPRKNKRRRPQSKYNILFHPHIPEEKWIFITPSWRNKMFFVAPT